MAADRIRRGRPFLSFLLFLGLDYIVYTYITTLYPPTRDGLLLLELQHSSKRHVTSYFIP